MINSKLNYKRRNYNKVFLMLVIFLSNVTQLPFLIENTIGRYISIIIWSLAFVLAAFQRKYILSKTIIYILLLSSIYLYNLMLGELVHARNYLSGLLVYPVFLSLFIMITGYLYSSKISEKDYYQIAKSYVISTLIVSFNIYNIFFSEGFDWENRSYAYGSKNSISQIILTAIIILVFYYKPQKGLQSTLKYIVSILLTVQLLMLKSRASILGLPIILFIYLIIGKNKTRKKTIILSVLLFIVILAFNENFYNLIINNILLGSRDINNLNDLSSGRTAMLTSFPKLFLENPLIGHGKYYIESFPLNALLENGIIGGLPILIISMYPLFWSLRKSNKNSNSSIILIMLSSVYLFNGLFESLAPFGPGIKNYMLWFLFGLSVGWRECGH